MTTSTDDAPFTPHWKPINAEQRRVLGVLIEKAKTTPAGYPMTVNAIVNGCNQKNNRDPAMSLDDWNVERILEELRTLGAVAEAPESTRTAKFRHRGYEWLGVTRAELAVIAELLLRGAQTLGDLRGRAARMEPIADLAALKPIVAGLVARGLIIELTDAGRGQVVSHNLYLEPERAALAAQYGGGSVRAVAVDYERELPGPGPRTAPSTPAGDAVAGLAAEVAELRAEVGRLREQVQALESRLSSAPR